VEIHFKGEMPESSANKFLMAMSDSHVNGLVEHCVEVLVWRRTIIGFCVGVVAGYGLLRLLGIH
jgi:hypothetical protein